MMSLSDLHVMTVVVSEGGINSASLKLFKTPSAISQSIKRLENRLNIKIFDRSGYRMTLTEAGQVLFSQAQQLLLEAQRIEEHATLIATGQERQLTVAANHVVPEELYLDVLSMVSAQQPGTDIKILKDGFSKPHDRLESDEADMAFVCGNTLSHLFQNIEYLPLGRIELCYVMHRSIFKQFDTKEKLRQWLYTLPQILIAHDDQSDTEQSGFLGNRIWKVNDLASKIHMLRRGIGWGRVPSHRIAKELKSGDLIPLSGLPILKPAGLNLWVTKKADKPLGTVGQAVWQALKHTQNVDQHFEITGINPH